MNKPLTAPAAQPLAQQTGWLVQSDFDGTITRRDVTDSLLTRFGLPGWQELEDAWERGDIGSRECMKGQVALLDMSREAFLAHLDALEVDPGFVGFVAAARQQGLVVQVVSDGLDWAIAHILARHGLGDLPVFANRLEQVGERSWRLHSPWASGQCRSASGNCKCQRLAEAQALAPQVLYIGDSTSDFCVSHQAQHVLAKGKLIAYCQQHGIAHTAFTDFAEATGLLHAIVQQPVRPAPPAKSAMAMPTPQPSRVAQVCA